MSLKTKWLCAKLSLPMKRLFNSMKDYDENYEVDFTKFLKKIHEIEAQKAQVVFQVQDPNEETPQRKYIKRYDERAVNRIYIGRR